MTKYANTNAYSGPEKFSLQPSAGFFQTRSHSTVFNLLKALRWAEHQCFKWTSKLALMVLSCLRNENAVICSSVLHSRVAAMSCQIHLLCFRLVLLRIWWRAFLQLRRIPGDDCRLFQGKIQKFFCSWLTSDWINNIENVLFSMAWPSWKIAWPCHGDHGQYYNVVWALIMQPTWFISAQMVFHYLLTQNMLNKPIRNYQNNIY